MSYKSLKVKSGKIKTLEGEKQCIAKGIDRI